MKKLKLDVSKCAVVLYWLVFIALLGLFFTNDFGLVDIHKTSIITAVGIDFEEEEVQVTAEVAVPQPSQSGESIKYTQVQGSGRTIADALNEINSKTGFYPKLQFCKLILVGETCLERDLFQILGCFYRKNYSELTALVATCEGNAKDMLAMKSDSSDRTSEAIRNVLSDEIKKSANANSTNLKEIANAEFSKSATCYMPYIQVSKPGTSESGGDGDNVGGESAGGGSGSGGGSSGSESGGGEGGASGGGGGGSSGGQSGGSNEQPVEFTARKVACFSGGMFKCMLDEQQSFALAVLTSDIRLAVLPCDANDIHYTIGLKNVSGGAELKVKDGVPEVNFSFFATAQIQGARVKVDPEKTVDDDRVPEEVLKGAEQELERRMVALYDACKENKCDILQLGDQLYKFNNKYYEAFKNDILDRAKVTYDIEVVSVN